MKASIPKSPTNKHTKAKETQLFCLGKLFKPIKYIWSYVNELNVFEVWGNSFLSSVVICVDGPFILYYHAHGNFNRPYV